MSDAAPDRRMQVLLLLVVVGVLVNSGNILRMFEGPRADRSSLQTIHKLIRAGELMEAAEAGRTLARQVGEEAPATVAAAAETLLEAGDPRAAYEVAHLGYERRSDHMGLRLTLARAALARGDVATALTAVKGIPEKAPEFPAAAALQAEMALEGRSFERAADLARKALDRAPSSAAYLDLLGRSLELSGDVPGAREAYRNALRRDPTRRHLGERLFRLAELAGDAKAIQRWRPYLTSDG